MNTRPSFLIYKSFYEPIKSLTNEEKGQLFDALFQYQVTGITAVTPVTPVTPVKIAYNFFVNQFQLDDKKYDDFIIRQKEKGQKSALKRWEKDGEKVTAVIPVKKKVTKVTYKDKDKDKDVHRETASITYLLNIPLNDLEDLHKICNATDLEIAQKGIALHDYCQAKGKRYKNYNAFLRNALRRDYPLVSTNNIEENFIKKLGYRKMN